MEEVAIICCLRNLCGIIVIAEVYHHFYTYNAKIFPNEDVTRSNCFDILYFHCELYK